MNLSPNTREILFFPFTMVIGALAGFGAVPFLAFIDWGQWAFWPAGGNFLEQVGRAPWWFKLLIPTLGGLAIGPIVAWLPELQGPGVSEVIEAAALREGQIAPRIPMLKTLCTGLIIATGGSVGREGPVVQIGSAIGSSLAQFFNFTPEKTRVCLACGAAAGIAAIFNAPFAGTMFAVEIILADLQIAYLGHIVLAAVVGVVVARVLLGNFSIFTVPIFKFGHHGELGVYLVLGLMAGLVSILLIRAINATNTLFRQLPFPEWLKPALGGVLLGALGLLTPHIFGGGYDSVDLALAGKIALAGAMVLILAKILATALCLGSGMSGGIFGPALFIGAMLGTSLAGTVNVFSGLNLYLPDYALVGMGAVVSGVTLGPITAILIIFELTNTYQIIVPLMVSCVVSMLTVRYLYSFSIYEVKLLRRGVTIVRGHEVNILRSLKVRDYMTTQWEGISDDTPLPEIMRKAEESSYPFFVVLDEGGNLSGVLTLWDLRKMWRFPEDRAAAIRARDLMTAEVITLTPENNFETAFYLFERKNVSFLPVVLPPERKRVVGILKAEDLLAAHNQRVLKDRFLQLPPKGEQKSRGESWPDGR